MTVLRGGEKLEAYLRRLADKVSEPGTLAVGFLEGATYPNGTKVALVAAVQNFGAPSRGVPPRPFFTNMIRDKSHEWGPVLGDLLKTTEFNARAALSILGEGIQGQLVQSIRDTNDPPLADETIARKGFAKPLIDTGHMWNSTGSEIRT